MKRVVRTICVTAIGLEGSPVVQNSPYLSINRGYASVRNCLNLKRGFQKPYKFLQPGVAISSLSHSRSTILIPTAKSNRSLVSAFDSYTVTMNNNMNSDAANKKCEFLKQEPMCTGKWLSLNKTTYRDARGKDRTWETVERTTRREHVKVDAVCMVAVLKRVLHYDCMVFVKQYRPAMKSYTIEFPAGLVDANETLEETSLREMKEETGYTATVTHVGSATALDPGVSNCNVAQVSMQIDGDDPANEKPRQSTDEGESIEVLLLPIHRLVFQLQDLAKKEDVVIDSRVYAYALGLYQSKELFNTKRM